jgi:hypothetical protein
MMPAHRRLIAHLELALECLEEAGELDAFLPHWAQTEVGTMAEDLAALLERIAREIPTLAQDESDDP